MSRSKSDRRGKQYFDSYWGREHKNPEGPMHKAYASTGGKMKALWGRIIRARRKAKLKKHVEQADD